MLEKEAGKKWCPMARVSGCGLGTWYSNRDSKPNRSRLYCLGSECACWVDDGDNKDGQREGSCGLARYLRRRGA